MGKKSAKRNNKNNGKSGLGRWLAILAVIMLLSVGYYTYTRPVSQESKILATVNDEPITESFLNQQYENLPKAVQATLAKEDLLESLIEAKLLEQEAKKQGIEVASEEVQKELNSIKANYESESDFNSALKEEGITVSDLEHSIKSNIAIFKLVNSTILSKIDVSDDEINSFYKEKKGQFEGLNLTLKEISAVIRKNLLYEKQQLAVRTYISQLKVMAAIKKGDEVVVGSTFISTGEKTCYKDEKPVIRFYSSTGCRSCKWIQGTFYDVINDFNDSIVAYHWVMDKGDNGLTEEMEEGIPKEEWEIYKKYNPNNTLPTFVFGCSYMRIGNGYESTFNLEAEKAELTSIIRQLVNE